MDFKTRKIRKKIKQKKIKETMCFDMLPTKTTHGNIAKKSFRYSIPVVSALVIIVLLFAGIAKALSSIDFTFFLKAAGDELLTDSYGHTNFLLLGMGGENHEGGDLTDTIIVTSLDHQNHLITMLSIPRDLWIQDSTVGNSKINEVYYNAKNHFGSSIQGLEHMRSKIEEVVGVPIHYWVRLDFKGFKELIDAMGGIDVYVENDIYDPYYPLDGTYNYQTFQIKKGDHHLDGETALKYARSRKTTSDFDRADRQQQIIFAIKQRALQSEIMFNTEKIKEILTTLKENIDTNIKVKEIITLGAIAKDYSPDQILHRLIHDDPNQCGGFLYTPERQAYGGLFVLVPAGGLEFIHKYSDLNFNLPQVSKEESKIHILNGTKVAGVAGETKQILQRFCFDVVRFGNARSKDITTTTYYYRQETDEKGNTIEYRPQTLNFLQKMIPGAESTELPAEYQELGYFDKADIIVEIGSDYTSSEKYVEDPFYYLYYLYSAPATTTETETAPSTTTATTE